MMSVSELFKLFDHRTEDFQKTEKLFQIIQL